MKSKIYFCDRKMLIPLKNGTITRYYGELMYIMFNKPYCELYFIGDTKYMVENSLQYMIENLPRGGFIKCNRMAIVNICYHKIFCKNPPTIVMDNGQEFKLSRKNIKEFELLIKKASRLSPPCYACYSCDDNDCENQIVFCRRKNARPNEEPEKSDFVLLG